MAGALGSLFAEQRIPDAWDLWDAAAVMLILIRSGESRKNSIRASSKPKLYLSPNPSKLKVEFKPWGLEFRARCQLNLKVENVEV